MKSITQQMTATIVALGATLLVGCNTMQYGDASKPAATMPAPTAAKPAAPAAPAAPVAVKPATPAAPTPPVQASAQKIIRIKAGTTTAYTDKAGNVWEADRGSTGGDTTDRAADMQIAGTNDPQMYRSERYSLDGYTITVPNGKYKVNLYFAETYTEEVTMPGQRVFSINVQGKEIKDFDIVKAAGAAQKAYVLSNDVEVTNGKIEIKFTAGTQNPCINALEIIPS